MSEKELHPYLKAAVTGDFNYLNDNYSSDMPKVVEGEGKNALHIAASEGHREIIDLLVRKGFDVNQKTSKGLTAFHYAAFKGREDVVRALLFLGADPKVEDSTGRNALHLACVSGHIDIANYLVSLDLRVSSVNSEGMHCGHFAALGGNVNVLEWLGKHVINLSSPTKSGRTCLHLAAMKGHTNVIRWFASQNDNQLDKMLVAVDVKKTTPLHLAVAGGHYDVALCLLDLGASATALDFDGKSPAALAAAMAAKTHSPANDRLKELMTNAAAVPPILSAPVLLTKSFAIESNLLIESSSCAKERIAAWNSFSPGPLKSAEIDLFANMDTSHLNSADSADSKGASPGPTEGEPSRASEASDASEFAIQENPKNACRGLPFPAFGTLNSRIYLRWDLPSLGPGSLPVQEYSLEYKTGVFGSWKTASLASTSIVAGAEYFSSGMGGSGASAPEPVVPIKSSSNSSKFPYACVVDLPPASEFTFRVRARNANGWGAFSEGSRGISTTRETVPSLTDFYAPPTAPEAATNAGNEDPSSVDVTGAVGSPAGLAPEVSATVDSGVGTASKVLGGVDGERQSLQQFLASFDVHRLAPALTSEVITSCTEGDVPFFQEDPRFSPEIEAAYVARLAEIAAQAELPEHEKTAEDTAELFAAMEAVPAPPLFGLDSNGRTLVHHSASRGQLNLLRLLIARGLPVDRRDRLGGSPLLYAVIGGHLSCVKYLASKGASVDTADEKGFCALHYAVRHRRTTLVRWLCEAGADPTQRTLKGASPADMIAQDLKALKDRLASTPSKESSHSSSSFNLLAGSPLPGTPSTSATTGDKLGVEEEKKLLLQMASYLKNAESRPEAPPAPSFLLASTETIALQLNTASWLPGSPAPLAFELQMSKKFSLTWDMISACIPTGFNIFADEYLSSDGLGDVATTLFAPDSDSSASSKIPFQSPVVFGVDVPQDHRAVFQLRVRNARGWGAWGDKSADLVAAPLPEAAAQLQLFQQLLQASNPSPAHMTPHNLQAAASSDSIISASSSGTPSASASSSTTGSTHVGVDLNALKVGPSAVQQLLSNLSTAGALSASGGLSSTTSSLLSNTVYQPERPALPGDLLDTLEGVRLATKTLADELERPGAAQGTNPSGGLLVPLSSGAVLLGASLYSASPAPDGKNEKTQDVLLSRRLFSLLQTPSQILASTAFAQRCRKVMTESSTSTGLQLQQAVAAVAASLREEMERELTLRVSRSVRRIYELADLQGPLSLARIGARAANGLALLASPLLAQAVSRLSKHNAAGASTVELVQALHAEYPSVVESTVAASGPAAGRARALSYAYDPERAFMDGGKRDSVAEELNAQGKVSCGTALAHALAGALFASNTMLAARLLGITAADVALAQESQEQPASLSSLEPFYGPSVHTTGDLISSSSSDEFCLFPVTLLALLEAPVLARARQVFRALSSIYAQDHAVAAAMHAHPHLAQSHAQSLAHGQHPEIVTSDSGLSLLSVACVAPRAAALHFVASLFPIGASSVVGSQASASAARSEQPKDWRQLVLRQFIDSASASGGPETLAYLLRMRAGASQDPLRSGPYPPDFAEFLAEFQRNGLLSLIEPGQEVMCAANPAFSDQFLPSKEDSGSHIRLLYAFADGKDTFPRDSSGRTALHVAAAADNVPTIAAIVTNVVQHAAAPATQPRPVEGLSIITEEVAAVVGHAVSVRDRAGMTPLHYAVAAESVGSTAILLLAGAQPSARDLLGRSPLAVVAQAPSHGLSGRSAADSSNSADSADSDTGKGFSSLSQLAALLLQGFNAKLCFFNSPPVLVGTWGQFVNGSGGGSAKNLLQLRVSIQSSAESILGCSYASPAARAVASSPFLTQMLSKSDPQSIEIEVFSMNTSGSKGNAFGTPLGTSGLGLGLNTISASQEGSSGDDSNVLNPHFKPEGLNDEGVPLPLLFLSPRASANASSSHGRITSKVVDATVSTRAALNPKDGHSVLELVEFCIPKFRDSIAIRARFLRNGFWSPYSDTFVIPNPQKTF